MTNKNTLPILTLDVSSLEVQTHEKYGESLILKNNSVQIGTKIYKLTSFPIFEKLMHDGREISVKTTCLALREVKASVVTDVTPGTDASKQLKANEKRIKELEAQLKANIASRMPLPVK